MSTGVGMLTVAQVARRLGVSKMTVYRLIHTQTLPAVRVGRSLRVQVADLDMYLRGAKVDGSRSGT